VKYCVCICVPHCIGFYRVLTSSTRYSKYFRWLYRCHFFVSHVDCALHLGNQQLTGLYVHVGIMCFFVWVVNKFLTTIRVQWIIITQRPAVYRSSYWFLIFLLFDGMNMFLCITDVALCASDNLFIYVWAFYEQVQFTRQLCAVIANADWTISWGSVMWKQSICLYVYNLCVYVYNKQHVSCPIQ